MTRADSLSLALPPGATNEEDDKLEERAIRLELLVEVVLADVVTDWDDSAARFALPVEAV